MPLAHVAGVPVEELLPALAGAGGLLLLARGWVALRLRQVGGWERSAIARNLWVTLTPTEASMAAQTDRIERDVLIRAPIERVWELITTAEHLGTWFGDAGAEVDLRPGGELTLTWQQYPTVRGRIETVDSPRRFSWRWLHASSAAGEPTPANSTLVEFTLTAQGEHTRVAVVESGFDALDVAERSDLFAAHSGGWAAELNELADRAANAPARR